MTKIQMCIAAIILILGAGLAETGWGRGFGGMHGGMHMGGMRPGGMGGMRPGGMGGMRPGGMGGMRPGGMGGVRPGGMNMGGVRPGGINMGGVRPGGINMAGMRPGANFGGARPGGFNPTNSVGNRASGFGGARPGGFNPTTGVGGRGFPGASPGGFGGNRGGLPVAGGGREPGLGGGTPDRSKLGSFLGMPSDGGVHAVANNRLAADRLDANRLAADRLGGDARGLARQPNDDLRRRGDDVRRDFRGRDFYSENWYRRYPGAWYPSRWATGDVWAAATWDSMDGWFGYGDEEPIYYDYGNTVTYQDNSVYMNGQDMGTSDQYYQQAQTLASTGAEAQTTDDTQWMPLGVFAMSHDQQTKANLILQLAVSKDGTIRGNYTATLTNDTQPVQGSVDKKTQRAAWTVGKNTENVMETGIFNLTKDEAPILVHFGKDKTEQWLLVRVKQDAQQNEQPTQDNQ